MPPGETTQNQIFFFALVVLVAVHTAISLGAWHWLTKTTVLQEWPRDVPVEVTAFEYQRRGEKIYIANKRVVSRMVPWPVPLYIWAGYAGLAGSALIWLIQRTRPIH